MWSSSSHHGGLRISFWFSRSQKTHDDLKSDANTRSRKSFPEEYDSYIIHPTIILQFRTFCAHTDRLSLSLSLSVMQFLLLRIHYYYDYYWILSPSMMRVDDDNGKITGQTTQLSQLTRSQSWTKLVLYSPSVLCTAHTPGECIF